VVDPESVVLKVVHRSSAQQLEGEKGGKEVVVGEKGERAKKGF
jgi:hypothetical protein